LEAHSSALAATAGCVMQLKGFGGHEGVLYREAALIKPWQ
jgi:hypothetical protein